MRPEMRIFVLNKERGGRWDRRIRQICGVG